MDTPNPSTQHPPIEEIEEAASFVGLAVALALRAVEVVGSLIWAVLASPYLLVRHLRGHHVPHASVFAGRVRHAWSAILDLLPHRVLREARRHPLL
jgi:hypothetical protein